MITNLVLFYRTIQSKNWTLIDKKLVDTIKIEQRRRLCQQLIDSAKKHANKEGYGWYCIVDAGVINHRVWNKGERYTYFWRANAKDIIPGYVRIKKNGKWKYTFINPKQLYLKTAT